MNAGLKKIAAGGLAALTLAGSVLASSGPASARPVYHGYHRYGYHHYGYRGGPFPGLIAGLIGGIAVAALSRPYYEDYGPYYYGGYPDYGYSYGYGYPSYGYGYGYGVPYRRAFPYHGFRGGFHPGFGGFHPGGFHPSFAGAGHGGRGGMIWRHR